MSEPRQTLAACQIKSNQIMSCQVILCHVMSCHVMSSYVILCHLMSCQVILCHVSINAVPQQTRSVIFSSTLSSPVWPYAKQDADTPLSTLFTISAPTARCTPSCETNTSSSSTSSCDLLSAVKFNSILSSADSNQNRLKG